MKRYSPTEQKLIIEGRDLLRVWALEKPERRDARCAQVATFLQNLHSELPSSRVLPLFVSGAGFAAVMVLARDGHLKEAAQLVADLITVADLCESAEGKELTGKLQRDFAACYADNSDNRDLGALFASARAALGDTARGVIAGFRQRLAESCTSGRP